jgi:general nucleoside transport system permease protein
MIATPSREARIEAFAIPFTALVGALTLFGLFCAAMGASPVGVFASMYRAGFGSWYSWQNSLLRASPLILCALATALPAQAGIITVGNEGAFVVGGLAAAATGLATGSAPAWVGWLAMMLAGGGAGGVWIAVAAGLQYYRGVNAVISSLLLNYIGIALLLQLVEGPMHDPYSFNFPATRAIPETHQLGHILGSRIHYGLVFGVVASVLAWFLLEHTVWGMKVKTIGGNARAAKLVGLPLGRIILTAGFLGGACAGLAGMVEVDAIHGRASEAISAGYGYVGILVAFLARQSPLRILVVSVLLGAVLASGGILQRDHELPDATVAVFEGIAFLVYLASEALSGRFSFMRAHEAQNNPEMADAKS